MRILSFSLASLFVLTAGCTHVSPWQRGTLAHPTMVMTELDGPGEEHLRAVQEGASGGGSAAASGCGCN